MLLKISKVKNVLSTVELIYRLSLVVKIKKGYTVL